MRTFSLNTFTIIISLVSLLFSGIAIWLAWSIKTIDYDTSVVVQPGVLPLTKINMGKLPFTLEISNTSKSNLSYFLRARTNMGCLNGIHGRPMMYQCEYESQVIRLSKSDGGKSTYKHSLELDAYPGAVNIHPQAYISSPDYFLAVEIIDDSNKRVLYKSECFYGYHKDAHIFGLDQPIIDGGESKWRQRECRA